MRTRIAGGLLFRGLHFSDQRKTPPTQQAKAHNKKESRDILLSLNSFLSLRFMDI